MASRASPLGRSPLRSQLSTPASRRLKPSISSAASAQLRHLQEVAAWASAVVPPLGAFLGSHLASTSEHLGCPPPSSPHINCQRCESILQVGVNCSVRVRSRKLKKRGTVTKGVTAPINSIIYTCQYCAFENVKPGTSKAYVKTKLSEVAPCRKLSEPCQKLNDSMAEVCQPANTTNDELISSPKLLTESAGSTGKRAKRKGWLSLKQLAASSADLSPAGSRVDSNVRSAKSPLLPQVRLLDSPRVMPAVSQGDFKCVTPVLSIEEKFLSRVTSIKTTLELEQCNSPAENIGCDKNLGLIKTDLARLEQFTVFTAPVMCSIGDTTSQCVPQLEVSDSDGIVATSLQSDAEVIVPISSNEEKPLTNATDLSLELEQSNAFGLVRNVEDKRLQQKLSFYHSDADAAKLEEFTLLTGVSKCFSKDTKAAFEAQWNSSDAVSQPDLEIVTPPSSIKGLAIDGDEAVNLSTVNPVVDASLPSMFKDVIDQFDRKVLQSPVNKEGVLGLMTEKVVPLNVSIERPVVYASSPSIFKADAEMLQSPVHEEVGLSPSRKIRLDDDDSWCKISTRQESCKPQADSLILGNSDGKETSRMMLAEISGSIRRKINNQFLAPGREVKSTMKKKPLFRRVGRQWFTICKSNRTLKWRII
eukprot:c2118_g1_i1 orf=138-2072(+)